MVSTKLKNISQIGNLPQIGVKIKKYLKPPPSRDPNVQVYEIIDHIAAKVQSSKKNLNNQGLFAFIAFIAQPKKTLFMSLKVASMFDR